ncbi:MAG: hypothetical protein IIV18_03085 [Lachnospiraceae bacterium]|nr:hypothetical protein [Lachnospiraceae bacterium]
MPDLNDYHAFTSTSGGSSGGGGGGCSSGCLPWVLGALFLLWAIGTIFS